MHTYTQVNCRVQVASAAWAQHALQQPLTEAGVHAAVHLVGVANYGPHQDAMVTEVLSQLQPDLVALELPLSTGASSAMLPYPAFVQVFSKKFGWLPSMHLPLVVV